MDRMHGSGNGRSEGTLGRILLVEDHKPLASLRRLFLAQQGYEVLCARNGELALRLLKSEPFQLVVADAMLPPAGGPGDAPGRRAEPKLSAVSGWEVAAFAKQRGVPVIFSTGWPVRLSAAQLHALGVDYLCPKPCSLNQLLNLIEAALRKSVGWEQGEPLRLKHSTKASVRKPPAKCDH